MSRDAPAELTAARFAALLDAYGAEPARWPEDEREAARRFAATQPQTAEPLLAAARTLDRAMDAALDAHAPPALSAKALAGLHPAARRPSPPGGRVFAGRLAAWWGMDWMGGDWRPAGALAAALVLGLLGGTAAPALAPFAPAEAVAADPTVEALAEDAALYFYGPAAALETPAKADQTEASR